MRRAKSSLVEFWLEEAEVLRRLMGSSMVLVLLFGLRGYGRG